MNFETWLQSDLTKPLKVQTLHGLFFSADNAANRIGIEVFNAGLPAALSGTCIGYAIRADGGTLTITGAVNGNKASIILPTSAYVIEGPLNIVIKIVSGSVKTTIGACQGYVQRATTDTIIDPGHVIPSMEELLALIEPMEQGTAAANAAAASANTAATNANNKASAANTAATNANNAASTANTAATNANTARDNANAAADAANAAAAAAPTQASSEIKYQVSTNGTNIPTGQWQDAIPNVPQGSWLWVRTIITWDNGEVSDPIYSKARSGIDGSGSVVSVNSLSPDANGNVNLGDIVHTVNGTAPDSSGNVALGSLVKQVNSISPDNSGNVSLGDIVHKVNNVSPDSGGNVALPIDDAPTAGSSNPVTSGGIKTALDEKIASLGANLITSVSDDTVAFWLSKGSGYVYFNVADCLHGQPYRFGFLVSYVYGTNVYQEFYSTNDFTGPYYRFANTSQTAMPSFEAKTKEGSITFASGIATASDTRYPTKVFRYGNVICLQAAVQTTDSSNFSSTYRELFTLPVGYRPAYRIMAAGCVGNSIWNQTFAAKINIESGGAVSVYIPSTSATNANMCQFCVSFIV